MAKRFTDTELWHEDWFIALPKDYRNFWIYIKDDCDHAGIWRPKIAGFNKLYECSVDLGKAFQLLNQDCDKNAQRIILLKNGRWFLIGFIPFQYGTTLNLLNRVHRSVYELLLENEVNLTSIRPQLEVIQGLKDKDKDKDKDKILNNKGVNLDFETLWNKYPNKVGKKEAYKHFMYSVKTDQDWQDIQKALTNYLNSKRVFNGYVQNAKTFFNNWRDWVDYKEPVCLKCKGKGKYQSSTGYEIVCDCPDGKKHK
jgi:hypothetical protein